MKRKIFRILLVSIMMAMILPVSLSATAFSEDTVTEDLNFDSINAVMEKIDAIGEVTVYAGNRIKDARSAYDELTDSQKELVENFIILTDAETAIADLYAAVSNTDHTAIYEATGQYIAELGTPSVGSVGGEWMVLSLTRSGRDCPDGYYENVVAFVNENINDKGQLHRAKSTENSRVILALTSAGYDVTNVDGHNLLCGLSDMNYLKRQGINGPIWALIALDSYGYEIPQNNNEETQATRETIISYLLEKQFSDGGWALAGNVADPDITGMAIQALAPYYHSNPDVEVAVERALECLSSIQYENGSFGSVDGICAESCAQVIVALTALGIDPETDDRFVKNGISVVDALCMFSVEEGGFEHIPYSGFNGMATEQGQYALTAYFRYLEGKTFLYDMTDVTIFTDDDTADDDVVVDEDPIVDEDEIVDEVPVVDESPIVDEDQVVDEEIGVTETVDAAVSEEDSAALEDTASTEMEEPSDVTLEIPESIPFTEDTFMDVQKKDWHYESVKYVYENNLMQGTDNGFEPDSKMTRAMLVTVLYRMATPENMVATYHFSDVPEGQWYTDAIIWAAENNVVSGVGENQFAPEAEITREQMALMIYRYAKKCGVDVSGSGNLDKFADANEISDWALDAMKWANSVDLINGTSDTMLSPKHTATRAQVATILLRFCSIMTQ
ncbi:MAG: S-layer homology domain-containing protein [Clostridia bacterium]|nr:S-layer homology domain-containing protein [Clostridia bacterium]